LQGFFEKANVRNHENLRKYLKKGVDCSKKWACNHIWKEIEWFKAQIEENGNGLWRTSFKEWIWLEGQTFGFS
jgi:hypothetical protein